MFFLFLILRCPAFHSMSTNHWSFSHFFINMNFCDRRCKFLSFVNFFNSTTNRRLHPELWTNQNLGEEIYPIPLKCVTNLIDLMNFLSVRSTRHIYSLKLFWLSGTSFFLFRWNLIILNWLGCIPLGEHSALECFAS